MKTILIAVFLLFVRSEIMCLLPEVQSETNNIVVDQLDTCVMPDGQRIRKNEMVSAKIGECYGIRCNTELELEDELCGIARIGNGCHGRSYNFSVPYPTCCPAAVCD